MTTLTRERRGQGKMNAADVENLRAGLASLGHATAASLDGTLGFLGADVELADSDVSSDKIRMREKYLAERKAVSVLLLQGPSRLRARADGGVPTCACCVGAAPSSGCHRTSRTTGAKWYLPYFKRAFAQLSANPRSPAEKLSGARRTSCHGWPSTTKRATPTPGMLESQGAQHISDAHLSSSNVPETLPRFVLSERV